MFQRREPDKQKSAANRSLFLSWLKMIQWRDLDNPKGGNLTNKKSAANRSLFLSWLKMIQWRDLDNPKGGNLTNKKSAANRSLFFRFTPLMLTNCA
jgi:hypothetical protein